MVYFFSDVHLGNPRDRSTRERERRLCAFLDSIRADATEIYLLGDILDYWFDYRYVVPRGFVRFFGKLAEFSDRGIKIVWMIGNHDIWMRGYLSEELGIEVIDGTLTREIKGQQFFLTHGDGVGKMPWTFRMLRKIFRNPFCQWLYSGIHPRWTIPFAYAWSAHSRANGCPGGGTDRPALKTIREFTKAYHRAHPEIEHFVYGHLHLEVEEEIAPGCTMTILGEWLTSFTYATFDGKKIELKNFHEAEIQRD